MNPITIKGDPVLTKRLSVLMSQCGFDPYHGWSNTPIYVDLHDGEGPRRVKRIEVHESSNQTRALVIVPENREEHRARKVKPKQ